MPTTLDPQHLARQLADPSFRAGSLAWLASLRTEAGYRLWSGSPPHLLATCFGVFLRELHRDLPATADEDASQLAEILLRERDPATGLFDRNLNREHLGPRHDRTYLAEQQTHFALQALRLLGRLEAVPPTLLEPWRAPGGLEGHFAALDWRDPWRESNRVMFALYFLEHELARGATGPWRERLVDGLAWLRRAQRPSGLWGEAAERRIYGAVYGAYHFLFFFLHWDGAFPRAKELLEVTRGLQTREGFFAHTRGGGACEDYDCVDILVKLGDDRDMPALMRTAQAVLSSRNADGGFPWSKPLHGGATFVLGNVMPALTASENARLFLQRLRDVSRHGRRWRYSGLSSLDCPAIESDVWSTWFRTLILAEIDSIHLHSGLSWGFRSFPSLGWHVP
jgi:hypothetical protein